MPIEIPESAAEVENRAKTDVQRELPESNPFLKNSWLSALITSFANRIFDFYLQLNAAILENFPDTATGTFLVRWAAIWGKQKIAATKAAGRVVATGTLGSVILAGEVLTVSGRTYTTTGAATITSTSSNVSGITRSGQTANVTTAGDHGLANNVLVTITGADQSEYNVTDAAITVTALNQFEYQVSGSPTTPATGAILFNFVARGVPVESNEFGVDQNVDAGTSMTLQSPIVGIDDTLVVDFGAVGGGTDQETDASLRSRTLDRIQNPVAHFSKSEIIDKAKEVAGVTRVFVQEITPAAGQVTIYFMRDDDVNPIPTGGEVTTVKNKILEIKPANTDDVDVIVLAPVDVNTSFDFTALSPDSSTMRTAITANLQQFFDENTEIGVNIVEDSYRAAIFNTVDTVTGAVVISFTLSAPSGDIVITSGQIGTLGVVTFSV